jgi:hypothetical protein
MFSALYRTAAGVLSEPIANDVAMTFVDPLSSHINNTFAVVRNANDVIIGQICSDVMTLESSFPSNFVESGVFPEYSIDVCFYPDPTIPLTPGYSNYDLGIRTGSSKYFVPMGLKTVNVSSDGSVCFFGIVMAIPEADLVLIKTLPNYDSIQQFTSAETGLIYTSAVLYALGSVLIFLMWLIVPMSLSFSMISLQSFLLMTFRSVYFFVLVTQVLATGGLLEYILVEIPTFFYLGIFFQILIMSYFTIHTRESKAIVWAFISFSIFLVWLSFAAIIIAMSLVPIQGTTSRECECRIVVTTSPSNDAQIIRIVYKSVILVVSLLVVFSVIVLWRSLLLAQTRKLFYQILVFSFCLFLNCLAFVVYYAINQPSAYFLIALWVTELAPVVGLVFLLAYPELWVWKNTLKSSFTSGSSIE